MKKIHHPHDNLFKTSFGKKLVTKDFLLNRLPPEVLHRIDIESLRRENNSFVDERLKAYYADIVFRVKTTEGDGYLFFLLEHQTEADELMPLRLLEYDIAIMRYDVEQQLKTEKGKIQGASIKLPVVINFVVFANEEYKYPTRLIDAFRTPDLLYRMFEDHFLVHLKGEREEKIMQDGEAALAGLLLREEYRKDFCKFLVGHPKIVELINDSTYATSAIMYILDRDPHDVGEVLEKLINLAPQIKDNVMTGLQRFLHQSQEKGIEKGMKKGLKEEKAEGYKEIIEKMVFKGKSIEEISEDVGLTVSEVKVITSKKKAA